MQCMAVIHSTRGWNSKQYAKWVLFKADFAVFWAPKEVSKSRIGCKTDQTVIKDVYSSVWLVPMQIAPSMDILAIQTSQKRTFFGEF